MLVLVRWATNRLRSPPRRSPLAPPASRQAPLAESASAECSRDDALRERGGVNLGNRCLGLPDREHHLRGGEA